MNAYTLIEQFLANVGLVVQSKIAAQIFGQFKPALMTIVAIGVAVTLWRVVKKGDMRPAVVYFVTVIALISCMKWKSNLSMNYSGSASDQGSAQSAVDDAKNIFGSEAQSAGSPVEVNGLFAIVAGGIDAVINAASTSVQGAVTKDSVAQVNGPLNRAVVNALSAGLDDSARQKIHDFLDPKTGCSGLSIDAAMMLGPDYRAETIMPGVLDWIVGVGKSGTSPDVQLSAYNQALEKLKEKSKGNTSQIDKCLSAPSEIKSALQANFETNYEKAGGVMGKLKGAWDWLAGKKDVIQASWMRTQISSAVGGVGAADSNSASGLLTRAWAWISEKYAGISQGVEAQKLIDWFPYIQGMVEAMIFAIFPFVLMASLFPGGWKALVHYFGAVLWVKSWTFFAVLISAVLDFCTATTISKSSAALDVAWDLTGLRWVANMMIAAVPLVSYIAIFGGVGGLGSLDFQPRGTETASMIVRQGAQQVAGTFRGGGGRPASPPSPGK